ncbi:MULTISPECIES: hypothetical protein [Enterocloster]
MADNAWCERHNIPLSSFYNAVTRLRKKACAIPDSAAQSDNLYTWTLLHTRMWSGLA